MRTQLHDISVEVGYDAGDRFEEENLWIEALKNNRKEEITSNPILQEYLKYLLGEKENHNFKL